jgi:two-component system, NtrC family, sensor kinase
MHSLQFTQVTEASLREVTMSVPTAANDRARVAALQKYAILDTDPEQGFDDLTLLASYICRTPIALISLIDENRQWFKSKIGLSVSETSREIALCSRAIQQSDVFVVPDTLQDERFRDNPLVVAEPNIRFYAGAPLINDEGYALGTLCVIDRAPREITAEQKEALQALSRLVLAQLEFRRNLTLLKEVLADRTKEEHQRQKQLLEVQEKLFRVLGLQQLGETRAFKASGRT